MRAFLRAEAGRPAPVFVETLPMDRALRTVACALAKLPRRASSGDGSPWDRAKVLELISLLLFVPVAAPAETISPTLQKFGVRKEPRPPSLWKPLASC